MGDYQRTFRMKNSPFLARCLLPFVALWLIILPYKNASAFVPAAVYAGMELAAVGGGGGGAAAAELSALAVAAAAAAMLAHDFTVIAPNGDKAKIPLGGAAPVPAGGSFPATFIPRHQELFLNGVSVASSPLAACNLLITNWNAQTFDGVWVLVEALPSWTCSVSKHFNDGRIGSPSDQYPSGNVQWVADSLSCPAGSSLSVDTCTITDPYAFTKGLQTLLRNGQSFSTPATQTAGVLNGRFGNSGGGANDSVWYSGTDANGQPKQLGFIALPNGVTSVVEQTQYADAAGNTQVKTVTVKFGSDGSIQSTTGTTQSGSIDQSSTTASGARSVTSTTNSNPVQSNTSSGQQTQLSINFPTDYARQGEAQSAADTVKTSVEKVHDDLSKTAATPADPAIPAVSDMPWFGQTFDNLHGWRLPDHVAACPRPVFDLSSVLGAGRVFTMESQCDLMANNSAAIRAAFIVMFTIMALFLVLRA